MRVDDTLTSEQGLVARLLDDVAAEHLGVDRLVSTLEDEGWRRPSAARGWTVSDVISHLTYYDTAATAALTSPSRFEREWLDPHANAVGADVEDGRRLRPAELLSRWREARTRLLHVAASAGATRRVPWYGPAMSLPSFLSARLMETWAHGVDISDALSRPPVVSPRLWHVCDLGIRARAYALRINRLPAPQHPLRVEVSAPDGATWMWGEPDVANRVTGSAVDLALVVTRRRLRTDTSLAVTGPEAQRWMEVAQAFAGPSGPPPEPGRGRR